MSEHTSFTSGVDRVANNRMSDHDSFIPGVGGSMTNLSDIINEICYVLIYLSTYPLAKRSVFTHLDIYRPTCAR